MRGLFLVALIIYIFLGGLCTEGNLRFQIDWASLILGRKFTAFLCLTLYLRAISKYKPPGGRGLVFGGAIYRRVFALRVWGVYILRGLYLYLSRNGMNWIAHFFNSMLINLTGTRRRGETTWAKMLASYRKLSPISAPLPAPVIDLSGYKPHPRSLIFYDVLKLKKAGKFKQVSW